MRLPQCKAIFFDAGGTLIDPYPSFAGRFVTVCEALDTYVSIEDVKKAEKDIWKEVLKPRSCTPYASSPERSKQFWIWFYKSFLSVLGYAGREDVAEELYNVFSNPKTYKVFPDVIPFLDKIAYYRLSMGVISNWERWLPLLLKESNIAQYFQNVTVSGEVGIEKPDKKIFEIALNKLNLLPGDTVYIGDVLETDIFPALELGMTPVLIDRKGAYKNNNIPCLKIDSLADLHIFFQ